MSYILLSIVASSCIFILFKLFAIRRIQTFNAIIINYVVAATLGFILAKNDPITAEIWKADWLWIVMIEGLLFVTTFYLVALTAQKLGISVASVAAKMSLVIPVILFLLIKSDDLFSAQKGLGILLACLAVYLVSIKGNGNTESSRKYWYLPVLLFLASGIIDFLLGYAEEFKISGDQDQLMFIPSIFMITGLFGIFVSLSVKKLRISAINLESIIAGAVLGFVNYGSLYYLMKAFNSGVLDKSVLYTLNNVGIVGLSAMVSLLFFKEKLSAKNWVGIGAAIVAILIIAQ